MILSFSPDHVHPLIGIEHVSVEAMLHAMQIALDSSNDSVIYTVYVCLVFKAILSKVV